ncbi:MAG: amidohydrolase [Anaerolineales bacterium]|nr:MAG: amidohydrolase [Anaerolineales bacterium]
MYDLLIQNTHVLHVSHGSEIRVLRDHDIAIQANRISAVEPVGTIQPSDARQIIQADGKLAMPGLINTHSHVPMVIFRGLAEDVSLEKWFNEYMWPLESNLQEEDVYWGMLLGLAEMIEAGVTSVADHYFYMDQAARAVQEAGTRAALGWVVFGNQGQAMLDRTTQFIERWQGAAGGRITAWLAPHAPYTCDDDFLSASAQRARDLGVGIHIHVAETAAQTQASLEKRGITPIRVLEETGVLERPTILAHAIGATPSDIQLLAERPAGVAHAPKTYLKLAMGSAPVVAFREAGVPVGLATDGAVSNNTLDIWESMRLMAMTQKQAQASPEMMTIAQVLHIATRSSARVVGLADQIGAVEPGYLADLILVDMGGAHVQPLHSITASLIYATRASDVQTVIVDGKVIMRDRKLLTLNKEEIIQQVSQAMRRLARRVPSQRIQVYNP